MQWFSLLYWVLQLSILHWQGYFNTKYQWLQVLNWSIYYLFKCFPCGPYISTDILFDENRWFERWGWGIVPVWQFRIVCSGVSFGKTYEVSSEVKLKTLENRTFPQTLYIFITASIDYWGEAPDKSVTFPSNTPFLPKNGPNTKIDIIMQTLIRILRKCTFWYNISST